MPTPSSYDLGSRAALIKLGIAGVPVRARPDPMTEIQHKLNKVFTLKMPKFDIAALLKRLTQDPFKQPNAAVGGKFTALRY